LGRLATGGFMMLDRQLLSDPDVRVSTVERRYLIDQLRADRFVQAWQQLRARREKLGGWQNAEARDAIDKRLRDMSRSIEKDPAKVSALVKRASQIGLGRQWSPEWSAHSIDGGMVRELSDQMRARSAWRLRTCWDGKEALGCDLAPGSADGSVAERNVALRHGFDALVSHRS
jgi:hypothetical protein